MEQTVETSGARVLEKAFDLLYSFESHRPEQSLFEISRKLKFPPGTTRRILKVLMTRRLIQQDAATKLYRLGPGVFYLASVARDGLDVRKIALAGRTEAVSRFSHTASSSNAQNDYRSAKTIDRARQDQKARLWIQLRRASNGRSLCHQRADF